MSKKRSFKTIIYAGASAALLTFGVSHAALAAQGPWTIQNVSGQAQFVDQDGSQTSAAVGTVVDGGDKVITSDGGRVVLARGEERITVSPSSEMGLPAENSGPFATQILQNLGTILLKVQKQPNQHFEVKTPYMAAVVKGTTFTVSVSDRGTAVHVVEGAVQVADLSGQQVQLVRPGQTATRGTNPNAPVDVSGIDIAPGKGKKAEAGKAADADGETAAASNNRSPNAAAKSDPSGDGPGRGQAKGKGKSKGNGAQIANAVGSIELNLDSATNGLASGRATVGKKAKANPGANKSKGKAKGLGSGTLVAAVFTAPSANGTANAAIVNANAAANSNAGGNGNGNGNSGGNGNGNSGGNGNGSSGGNGNGNSGGNGNGNSGGNGNGSSGGNGNGNSGGNGNGNSGGNGNGNSGGNGNGNSGGNGNGNSGGNGNGNSGGNGNGNGNN